MCSDTLCSCSKVCWLSLQGLPQAVPQNAVLRVFLSFQMCATQLETSKIVISQILFRIDCCHFCSWQAEQIEASPIMSKGPREGGKIIANPESESLLATCIQLQWGKRTKPQGN